MHPHFCFWWCMGLGFEISTLEVLNSYKQHIIIVCTESQEDKQINKFGSLDDFRASQWTILIYDWNIFKTLLNEVNMRIHRCQYFHEYVICRKRKCWHLPVDLICILNSIMNLETISFVSLKPEEFRFSCPSWSPD